MTGSSARRAMITGRWRRRYARNSKGRECRAEMLERLRAARIIPGPDYPGSVAEIRAIRDEE